MSSTTKRAAPLLLLLSIACSSTNEPTTSPDAATTDAGALDAAVIAPDAGATPEDAALASPDAEALPDAEAAPDAAAAPDAEVTPDAGPSVPLPGFGDVTGECGVLDDGEWLQAMPFFFAATVDFGTTTYDVSLLSAAGQEVIADGNAGGSSLESEAMSADLLYRCELATLLKTENEVGYTSATSKKADLLVEIDGRKVGVSVTRAYHYPPANPYTEAEATTLLTRKIDDLVLAQADAVPADVWSRSMVYVLAYSPEAATAMASAWQHMDPAVRRDLIIIVALTNGDDAFIY